MKYRAKEIDGEWLVVDENEDIVADAADRRDAITMANAMTRESSNADSKPNIHRGSSYGNKPEAELSEGSVDSVSDRIYKAIDLMYELTDDGQMAKNAYHDAKAKFKLGRTEAEIVLDIWNDSHKSDRRNFIEVETINESSGEKQYKVIFKRNQKGFSSSGMGAHAHLTREETISANDWDDAKEQVLAMMEPGEFVSTLKEIDPVSDELRSKQVVKAKKDMEESQEINELSKKTLGSYVKKATTNVSDKNFIAGHRRGMLSGMGKGDGRDKKGDDLMGKADKRKNSINLAVNKLTEAAPRITPDEAKSILGELEYSGDSKDFFTLRNSEVSKLLDHAKRLKYRKSKYAPGSTARMFYQYLTRLANKSGSSENIQEAYDKLTDKQLQDKFVSLKVKSKDLSKDSKDSKELQKIRDEIAKRKNLKKESVENIQEAYDKLTDKQLQDKFVSLKVKSKDLSKDSKDSKELQKIRDEIAKRKNLKKESVESQDVMIAESIINILFGNIK